MTDNLYFIAIIPNNKLREEITKEKVYFAENYLAKYALRTMPHITLIPPFKSSETGLKNIFECLNKFVQNREIFDIKIKDYNNFRGRVIYADIPDNEDLNSLSRELNNSLCYTLGKQIEHLNPHITIAFRDLSPSRFAKAWKEYEYKTYESSFPVLGISILKHINKRWQELKFFAFKENC